MCSPSPPAQGAGGHQGWQSNQRHFGFPQTTWEQLCPCRSHLPVNVPGCDMDDGVSFSISAHCGTRQENIMCRAPWGSFQTVRKSHILSLLEVKPEFISDINNTQKPAWQHSLVRNTLGFSKDGNQLKRHFSSWSQLLRCPWEAQLMPRCIPECSAGVTQPGAGTMVRVKDLPLLESPKQQQTQL